MAELSTVDKAIIFATEAHSGARRKSSRSPYILHPLEAAVIADSLARRYDEKTRYEIVAAAALHDVVEDTEYTAEDIRERFGERVAALVAGDSENKRRDLPPKDTWQQRKQETIDYVREKASREEKIVIFSDKLANLRSIVLDMNDIGDGVWQRFNVKDKKLHGWYYRSFLETMSEFEGEPAYEEYAEKIEKVFGNEE